MLYNQVFLSSATELIETHKHAFTVALHKTLPFINSLFFFFFIEILRRRRLIRKKKYQKREERQESPTGKDEASG